MCGCEREGSLGSDSTIQAGFHPIGHDDLSSQKIHCRGSNDMPTMGGHLAASLATY